MKNIDYCILQPNTAKFHLALHEHTRSYKGKHGEIIAHSKISLTLERRERGCKGKNWKYILSFKSFVRCDNMDEKSYLISSFNRKRKRNSLTTFAQNPCSVEWKNGTKDYNLFAHENHTWKNSILVQAESYIHWKYIICGSDLSLAFCL